MNAGDLQSMVGLLRPAVDDLGPDEQAVLRGDGGGYEIVPKPAMPARKRGIFQFQTVDGLVEYAKRHLDPATALLRAVDEEIVLTFDAAGQDRPGWYEHRASISLEHSFELHRWNNFIARGPCSQKAFMEHLDLNVANIAEPDAGKLIGALSSLKLSKEGEVVEEFDPGTGDSRMIAKAAQRSRGRNDGTLPLQIVVLLRIFRHSLAPVRFVLRLTHKVENGAIRLGLQWPIDFKETVEAEIDVIGKEIAGLLGGKVPFLR